MAMAARMPMIVITSRSSINVKPACRRVRVMRFAPGARADHPAGVRGMAFSPAQLSGAVGVRRRDADGRRVCGVPRPAALRTPKNRRHETVKKVTPIQMAAYLEWLEKRHGLAFDDYESLYRWSVTDLDAFWGSIREYFQLLDEGAPEPVLVDDRMP